VQTKKGFVNDISKGNGGIRYYSYWTGGIILTTKKAIVEAINLGLRLLRKDKITNDVQLFNYKTLRFDKINKNQK